MSGGESLPVSRCEMHKVTEVQFEVFKARQIKQYAACLVSEAKSFVNGHPARGGISDLRMGSTDPEFTCETCRMPHPWCPGHFGYIELAEPMFNIGLFAFVLLALRCVCKTCGALLISDLPDSALLTKGMARLREVSKLCSSKRTCVARGDKGCGSEQVKLKKPEGHYPGLKIICVENEQPKDWSGAEARAVLDRVSDEDARLMGFDPDRCHPRDLIITVLPVPPPQVRPTVSFGGAARSDNELSHKLMSILKDNERFRTEKESGAGRESLARIRALLQEHIATYFHNGSTWYKPSCINQKMPLKSLSERLKGKYGRLRGNLMGKRVDFSARTVITGDPMIDVDEVGVPRSVAMTLTFPERVNHLNRKRLQETVRRKKYPSAVYIIHPNGVRKKLEMVKNRDNITLQIGDTVERHLMDGDIVLFNRQPTLHRMSMMGHRVRVLPFNTFRLNLSCTTPYNADFDGDEMNLHVPQSLLTKAELIELMIVPKNFVSPNKSAPCMGIVQDSLLGCARMTDKECFLDKMFMQNLAMWVPENRWDIPIPAILKPTPLWTGKQVFSMVIPEVNLTSWHKDDKQHIGDESLNIRRGELLGGQIAKKHVGVSPGSLIHIIFNEKGSDEVSKFINGVQRTTAYYLLNASFSVGVSDTVADDATFEKIGEILKKTRGHVCGIAAKANDGSLKRKSGMTLLQSFEKDVNSSLNSCREAIAKTALSNVRRTNAFKCMIEAGSKGSDLNICQIAVLVGQQNVNGARIPFGFRRRTLPHFHQDDYGEQSRGMVNRGYLEGLRPHEFYFHTMGGREGLIDTAVKTADTGYLQRKLIKALEDVHAAYDGTTRNANREIVQLMYGEDGLDGQKIEHDQELKTVWLSNKQMAERFRFEYQQGDHINADDLGGEYLHRDVKKMLRANPHNLQELEKEFKQLLVDRDNLRKWIELENAPTKICLPVNIERAVRNAQATFEVGRPSVVSQLNPVDVIHGVERLQRDLQQFFATHHRTALGEVTNPYCQQRVDSALKLFGVHLRSMLASKLVVRDYRLNDKAFEFLLGEIRVKYLQAMVKPGEMIGAIAAQSCGEPATQMTLNTFHNAGISSKNVTLGVPRLQELLNVSRTQKHSSMQICLVPQWQERERAEQAAHIVEFASLETLTRRVQIFYDPNPAETVVMQDKEFVSMVWDVVYWRDTEERDRILASCSPWVVRLELDRGMFTDKQCDMIKIKQLITAADDRYFVENSLPNQEMWVIRLRLRTDAGAATVAQLKAEVPALLSKVHICGIHGVKKVLTLQVASHPIDPVTGAMTEQKTWCLDTEGTALKRVFGHALDSNGDSIVDHRKTASNNIPEVCAVLGIEAARKKLYLEMRGAYQAYGVNINYRHYAVLIDIMCHRGYLMAVSRVGINRSNVGPIMRASFEETVGVLMGAAASGEVDDVRGVSANLVLGNQSKVGTGLFDVMLNVDRLRSAVDQEEAVSAGKEANIYHSSVAALSVGPGVMNHRDHRTPLVGDPSVARHSASVPYGDGVGAASAIAGDIEFTPVHASMLPYGGAAGGGGVFGAVRPEDLGGASVAYSVQSHYSEMTASEYPDLAFGSGVPDGLYGASGGHGLGSSQPYFGAGGGFASSEPHGVAAGGFAPSEFYAGGHIASIPASTLYGGGGTHTDVSAMSPSYVSTSHSSHVSRPYEGGLGGHDDGLDAFASGTPHSGTHYSHSATGAGGLGGLGGGGSRRTSASYVPMTSPQYTPATASRGPQGSSSYHPSAPYSAMASVPGAGLGGGGGSARAGGSAPYGVSPAYVPETPPNDGTVFSFGPTAVTGGVAGTATARGGVAGGGTTGADGVVADGGVSQEGSSDDA